MRPGVAWELCVKSMALGTILANNKAELPIG